VTFTCVEKEFKEFTVGRDGLRVDLRIVNLELVIVIVI
jgi:hypothetical protein